MFCLSYNNFSMLFLLNLFKNLSLCIYMLYKTNNVFSFVQWDKYFHSVKDEMYHSTRLRLVEWSISSFTSWKYLYHCTHKHSLFVSYFKLFHYVYTISIINFDRKVPDKPNVLQSMLQFTKTVFKALMELEPLICYFNSSQMALYRCSIMAMER